MYLLFFGRFAQKAFPAYREIRRRISISPVVGSDETGARVNGKKHWFWTWQNDLPTYIAPSATHGRAAVEANFPNGLPRSILVHDCWNPQRNTPQGTPDMPGPPVAGYRVPETKVPKTALARCHRFHNAGCHCTFQGRAATAGTYRTNRAQASSIVGKPPDKCHKELYAFYRSIAKERGNLFTFLKHHGAPFDNNGSEKAIRNIKVKQKISGQFRTQQGAREFAVIRSVMDTTIKNGQNVLEALSLIAKLQPQTLR